MVAMNRSVGRIAVRGTWVSLTLTVLAGCSFGVPLKQPTVVPQQAERSATIRLGESTRDDVRAALGEPWLRSEFWRVEVYRADDKRTELGFMVAIVVPVPVGVFSEKRHGYVLVTYDGAGHASRVSSGFLSEGLAASEADKWLVIRSDEITLAVDQVRTKWRTTLIADSSRLSDYLAERRHAAGCTLVVACDEVRGCPDELAVDGGEPFDPSPITVLCAPDAPCPKGTPLAGMGIDGKSFVLVPVLHAIGVAPGSHRLRIAGSMIHGGGEASFACSGGEVLYGTIHSRVEGASWWSRGKPTATVTLSPAAPPSWDDYGFALYRDGRWLVSAEPDAN
jgi:hypothetical protein